MPDTSQILTPDRLADELRGAPEAPRPEQGDPPPAPPDGPVILDPRGKPVPDSPVTPLGKAGDLACFLDATGQLTRIKKLDIQSLHSLYAGRIEHLLAHWPKMQKTDDGLQPKRGEFDQTAVSLSLWQACGRLGIFNAATGVRGVGAWIDDEGALIYHLGNRILYNGDQLRPGRIGEHIYPAASPIPAPTRDGPDPVPAIMETVETWNWALPELHPFVVLGVIGCQMLSGALRWRPVTWLTAPAGAGKSGFQEMLQYLHGDGLIQSADASKAGITSRVGQSSLPVALDELEPGDERDSRKVNDIITLARVAASGGEWSRGSSDQTAVGGKVYSTFLFSSILIPGAMKTQDVQRLIRLDMHKLEDSKGLSLDPKTWRARGARLKGLLIQRWPSLRDRVARYRQALELAGVAGRAADNWEIVLAMADMAEAEALPNETKTQHWARLVALTVSADREDVQNDADAMLAHLLGQPMDPYRRGEQYTVAQWLMVAAGLPGAPPQLCPAEGDGPAEKERRQRTANDLVSQYGLRIYIEDEPVLFIANRGPALQSRLFEGTDWRGGAWSQSAKRVPLAYVSQTTKTLAGSRTRGVMIPLRSIPALCAFPEDKGQASAPTSRPSDELEDWR